MSSSVINNIDNNTRINVDPNNSKDDIAITDIIKIWRFMKNPAYQGRPVPRNMLQKAVDSVTLSTPTFRDGVKQDAHEFVNKILCNLSNSQLDNELKYYFKGEYLECKSLHIAKAV